MRPTDDTSDDRLLPELAREIAPPAELEEKLVRELRRRGRLGRPRWREGGWRVAASALLAFALGLWAGPRFVGSGKAAPEYEEGGRYLLLLYEPRPLDRAGGDLVAEYSAWAKELAREGRLVAAEKLSGEDRRFGSLLAAAGDAERAASPGAPGQPTGFFLIRAAGLEEAERIAKGCPHLGHGGELSLRPVDR